MFSQTETIAAISLATLLVPIATLRFRLCEYLINLHWTKKTIAYVHYSWMKLALSYMISALKLISRLSK